MGIYSLLKNIVEAKSLEAETRLSALRSSNHAMKMVEASWSKWVDPDPDENDWQILGTYSKGYKTSWENAVSTSEYLETLRSRARHLCRFDGTARGVIRNFEKFIWKTGPTINPNDDNPQCSEAWKAFTESQGWYKFGAAMIRQTFRDGEVFILDRGNKAKKRFALLPPERIAPPENRTGAQYTHGIETDPKDVTQPIAYWYQNERILAKDIIHIKINCDELDKRGKSILEHSLQDILDYRKFRTNRARLNHLRTFLGIVQEIQGGTAAFNSILAKNKAIGGTGTSETDSNNQTVAKEPGGPVWYTTKGQSKFHLLAPNLQAADAQNDGRMILLAIAAGQGQSETWVTADAQNANYASQSVAESPAVIEMQTWQRFFTPTVQEIYRRVIESAALRGEVSATYPQRIIIDGGQKEISMPLNMTCEVVWPELIHRDMEKEVQALSTMKRDGVLSGRTYASRLDLDFDSEMENKNRDKDQAAPEVDPFKAIQNGDEDKDEAEREDEEDDTEALRKTTYERIKEAMEHIKRLVVE